MEISGKLFEIYETKQVTDKFKKREFVVEYVTNPEYPQYIKFQLTQNNCDYLDGFSKGDMINIQFDLTGRPWTNQSGETTYFTSLNAWRIQKAEGGGNGKRDQVAESSGDMGGGSDSDNDLPF
ncbi:MAG TPA: DUF3127 domain-containing protein [Ignavibacteria bacterium]|nr:hypothetical protein [Bacteroidota bacterium]HRI85168.1 DUF3127 domain-containing protein [Ignavibacteria bacterium]HRJ99817.1 DUF3127 domain-containing protein [Ignavibacteria bacterium]